MSKEYWVCMIGPIERCKVRDGGDWSLRQAVKAAFYNLIGEDAEGCASGWGYSKKQVDAMRKAAYPKEE